MWMLFKRNKTKHGFCSYNYPCMKIHDVNWGTQLSLVHALPLVKM
jgi:hypothetical protein